MACDDDAAAVRNSDDQQSKESEAALLDVIQKDGRTFQHIMLYNNLVREGTADGSLEQMTTLHSNLLGYHGFMTGFQFLGLTGEIAASTDEWSRASAIVVLLVLGFLCSALGSMLSFLAIEYYNGMAGESSEMIVAGVLRYWKVFYMSDVLGFGSTGLLFLVTVNVLIYEHIPQALWYVCYVINIVTFLAVSTMLFAFHRIILARQDYGGDNRRHIYKHVARAQAARAQENSRLTHSGA